MLISVGREQYNYQDTFASLTNVSVLGSWSSRLSPSLSVNPVIQALKPPRLLIVCFHRYPSVGSRFSVGTYIILGRYNNLSTSTCRYEKCSWIPVFIVFVIATAVGGKYFVDVPTTPATAPQVFSFGATIAGFTLSWTDCSSDYTTYFHPRVSRFVACHVALHQSHSGFELN